MSIIPEYKTLNRTLKYCNKLFKLFYTSTNSEIFTRYKKFNFFYETIRLNKYKPSRYTNCAILH